MSGMELPPLKKTCIVCHKILPDFAGPMSCPDHEDEAAELVGLCNAGIPIMVVEPTTPAMFKPEEMG